jgi:hypothetical protein
MLFHSVLILVVVRLFQRRARGSLFRTRTLYLLPSIKTEVTNDSRSIVYPSLHLMNMSLSDNVQRRGLAFGYIYDVKYPAIYYGVEQL